MWQAAQAVEPAALIPLQMLKPCASVVLVGDPKQLPATVVSRAAEKAGLARSLFERLQQVEFLSFTFISVSCITQCSFFSNGTSRRTLNASYRHNRANQSWHVNCISARGQAGVPVSLLAEQYRMHPAISAWPSEYFYSGQLKDAPAVLNTARTAPFHQTPCFPPLAFFDCR